MPGPTLSTSAADRRARRSRAQIVLAVALAASVAAVAARAVLGADEGLAAQYFGNAEWAGDPAVTAVDSQISTDQIARHRRDLPPVFSARWEGYLTAWRDGTEVFRLASDVPARLYIDDRLIARTPGGPSRGRVPLTAGSHRVRIDYAHPGDTSALEWLWSSEGGKERTVPAWALSQRRASALTAGFRWLLDLLLAPLAGLVVIAFAWCALPTVHRRVVPAIVSAADSIRAYGDSVLLAAGAAVLFFALPHAIFADGGARFEALVQLLEQHTVSGTAYPLLGPLVSAPLYFAGKLALGPEWWGARFNTLVLIGGLGITALILRRSVDRGVLRTFFLLLMALSMFPNHLRAFYGEVFTSVLVLIGVAALVTGRTTAGWVAMTAGAVNTPASLVGLSFVAMKRVWDTRRLRHLLVVVAAATCILLEAWIRRGSPFVTAYEGNQGSTTVMPFSGLPEFSYPFWFGVLSILLSFGKGILFFAPGLLLPVAEEGPDTRPLVTMHRYLLLFVAGLIVVYAKWWSWYGGWFWGPRFFLAAAIPSALAIAVALRKPSTLGTPMLLGVLAALTLSGWVGISGAVFDQATLGVCQQDHFALEMLCWYTPEFSVLWRPFVAPTPLMAADRIFIAYAGAVYLWLAMPALSVLLTRTKRFIELGAGHIASWRI